jgi:uncharacterized protein with HEPN domain
MTDEVSKADLRAPDYVEHMLQACDRILAYTSAMTREDFLVNNQVQDAVIRNVEILGEATKNLLECLPGLQADYPEIPWIDIYGMRNRVAHGYFFVNLETVWGVVSNRITDLRPKLVSLLERLNQHSRTNWANGTD